MATALQLSILGKLKGALPVQWFGDNSPNSDAALAGPAAAVSEVYTLVQEIIPQMRIRTATDGFLNMITVDFFGNNLPRLAGESDDSFRLRILVALFRDQGTKAAMSEAIGAYTGWYPAISEYQQAVDPTGFVITEGNDTVSGYGAVVKPHHVFITVYTTAPADSGSIPGYGSAPSGYGSAGAYTPKLTANFTYLFQLINSVKPIGTKIWVKVITADSATLESTYGAVQAFTTTVLADTYGGLLSDGSNNLLSGN